MNPPLRSSLRFFLSFLCVTLLPFTSYANTNAPIQIGMTGTFFHDVPGALVALATQPFNELMRAATGLEGRLQTGGSAMDLAGKLQNDKLQLAVFHGFEFAWAQQKYPELRPLMVAMNKSRQVRAYVVVPESSPIKSLNDLQGKEFAVPKKTKEHCRVFLDKNCHECGQCCPTEFFKKLHAPVNVERGLDDLLRKKFDACVVDTLAMEYYKDLKPGLFKRLRVVQESEPFPPVVIVYRNGALDDGTLGKFREGLLNAHNLPLGRDMMRMWSVHAFEGVPSDFQQQVADFLKTHPSQAPAKVSMR